ncbi:MAG TPA: tetratricopeptide repeat protein [Gemmatimonadaceae bacterium]|jgi:tetratricopeptide (TPR) repeat protein
MSIRMSIRATMAAAMLLVTRAAAGQTAAEHIALGDKEYTARNLAAALQHYEEAVAVDSLNTEALWKASNAAIDLGEFNDAERQSYYARGEQLGRLAVKSNPNSSEAHFALAKAEGRVALSKGKRDKVKYAGVVHDEVHASLRLDSLNAGALHVLGMWNAEIMRLSRFERWAARNLLGGGVLGEANWDSAQRYLERAVSLEPNRITHRLDLAGVYADRGDTAKAREQYEAIAQLPVTDYNDPRYKQLAEERLRSLR